LSYQDCCSTNCRASRGALHVVGIFSVGLDANEQTDLRHAPLPLTIGLSEWVFNDSRSVISRYVSGGSDNFDIVSDLEAARAKSYSSPRTRRI
jgi:hypothetical protein